MYDLSLNKQTYQSGDPFLLTRRIWNPSPLSVYELIVLDIQGILYFWPSWGESADWEYEDLPAGESNLTVLTFEWPSGEFGSRSGLWIWGGCLNAETFELAGNVDGVMFGYE